MFTTKMSGRRQPATNDWQAMKRLGPSVLLTVILLAGCGTQIAPPDGVKPQAASAAAGGSAGGADLDKVGKVGPDGAPPVPDHDVADRGIGGTGAPVAPVAIATAIQMADRGIGGTGIVGVVTGFGSIFVDGVEVEYDDSSLVDFDGRSVSPAALRAGQVVAVHADGTSGPQHAKTISVRFIAAGQIEALQLRSGTMTIAGQSVLVPDGTWGANRFGLGDWVTVSGLRRGDGTIVASRLDPAPVGVLLARGQVVRDGTEARVGALALSGAPADSVKVGQFVVVSGDYAAGRGHVITVESDPLLPSPEAYFGSSPSQLILQAFVRVEKCIIWINGMQFKADALAAEPVRDGLAVVSLQRQADGSYAAVGLRFVDYRGHTVPGSGKGGAGVSLGSPRNAPLAANSVRSRGGQSGKGAMASAAADVEPNRSTGSMRLVQAPMIDVSMATDASGETHLSLSVPVAVSAAVRISPSGATAPGVSVAEVSNAGALGVGASDGGTTVAGALDGGTSGVVVPGVVVPGVVAPGVVAPGVVAPGVGAGPASLPMSSNGSAVPTAPLAGDKPARAAVASSREPRRDGTAAASNPSPAPLAGLMTGAATSDTTTAAHPAERASPASPTGASGTADGSPATAGK